MTDLLDISTLIDSRLPIWPGSVGWQLESATSADGVTNSVLRCDVHTGTHVDAPAHGIPGASTVERLPLDILVGEAFVCHLPDIKDILPQDLDALHIPEGTRRLLLRSGNSDRWGKCNGEFQWDFTALSHDAALWVVNRGIRLLGVDYLSVQRFTDTDFTTHRVLLSNSVVILEGLDLSAISPGRYELICLPLKLGGAEGSPARAILRTLKDR